MRHAFRWLLTRKANYTLHTIIVALTDAEHRLRGNAEYAHRKSNDYYRVACTGRRRGRRRARPRC